MRLRSLLWLFYGCDRRMGRAAGAKTFQGLPGRRVRELSVSPRLAEIHRMDPRAPALSLLLLALHGVRDGYHRWTIDYPRSDRHLLQGIRRLTRIDTRSVEQVVELDGDDEVYNWPSMYAVEVGYWNLTDQQADQLREFLLRGGFFMVRRFSRHRRVEQLRRRHDEKSFLTGISWILITKTPSSTSYMIWTIVFRFRGCSMSSPDRCTSTTGSRPSGAASTTTREELMVAICHNMDLGDAWENSDDPRYPEKFASLAYRIAVNYWTYDLTH